MLFKIVTLLAVACVGSTYLANSLFGGRHQSRLNKVLWPTWKRRQKCICRNMKQPFLSAFSLKRLLLELLQDVLIPILESTRSPAHNTHPALPGTMSLSAYVQVFYLPKPFLAISGRTTICAHPCGRCSPQFIINPHNILQEVLRTTTAKAR